MSDLSPDGPTAAERRALDAVDVPATVSLLTELLRLPSITGSAEESAAQHWMARRLEALGLDVDLWPVDLPALRAHPDFPGAEAPREEAWGLVATTPSAAGDDGPTLVLQGHVDVVPPGQADRWQGVDPFGGHADATDVWGRGACDMKGGVVANLAAVAALRAAGVRLRGRLAVHSVGGEEDGGLGAFATLQRGHRGDACVITEPTSRTVITATGGALTFRLEVQGRSAHGSTRYAGVSALEAFWPVHRALVDLERERCAGADPLMAEYPIPYPLSIGTVAAGDWASTVPEALVAQGRYGVALDEDPAAARAAFEERVAAVCAADPWLRDHPVTVTWWGGQFASGRLPAGDPLLGVVAGAWADVTGAVPPERGAPYGSDLRLYAAAGVPTLHLGPGDARLAHAARERVPIAEVADVARALVLTAMRVCGTH